MIADEVVEGWLGAGKPPRGIIGWCQLRGIRHDVVAEIDTWWRARCRQITFADGSMLWTTGHGNGWSYHVQHP